MGKFKDSKEYQYGAELEAALSDYLQRDGWYALEVYDCSGQNDDKAPAMFSENSHLILPDLFIVRQGRPPRWVEAKRKTHADFTRKTQQLETGLSLRLYRHYKGVKRESGLNVYIFFGHDKENQVRYCEVDAFPNPRTYSGTKMGPHGMVFFPWKELTFLCAMTELGLPKIEDPRIQEVEIMNELYDYSSEED